MKNLNLIKALITLSIIVSPVLYMHQNAYANTSSSKSSAIAYQLNVREAAENSSKIIGLVHKSDTVEIIQKKNSWDEIKLSNNQTRWVNNAYLNPTENIGAIVESFVFRIRENPSLFSKVICRLKRGTKITVQEEHAGWAKIVTSSGVQGWGYENYIIKVTPSKAKPVTVTPTAKTATPLTPDVNMATLSIPGPMQNEQFPLKGKPSCLI
jgi:N-acetylmuramoyl-L-alanine amidase